MSSMANVFQDFIVEFSGVEKGSFDKLALGVGRRKSVLKKSVLKKKSA